MKRSDIHELHYITSIQNVPSILKRGILCHRDAERIDHETIAMSEIQERRANKVVPNGGLLHTYVNLYFCARNPMMYKRAARHRELCVLQIDSEILDLPSVVITDGNAASSYTRFWPSPQGIEKIDFDSVFAENWMDGDQIMQWRKASRKCAEVLVPYSVDRKYVRGAYVSGPEARKNLEETGLDLPIAIDPPLFFRG
jgi:hypothetical protein